MTKNKKIIIGVIAFFIIIGAIGSYLQSKSEEEKRIRDAQMNMEKLYIALDFGYQHCKGENLPEQTCDKIIENKKTDRKYSNVWKEIEDRIQIAREKPAVEQCFYEIADKKSKNLPENEEKIKNCIKSQ